MMHDLAPWLVYAGALFGPFVQEDAAVFGAAASSVSMDVNDLAILSAVFVGLTVSDAWKYWAGRLAARSRTASKWISDPRVGAARDRVLNRLGVALMVARFVPGTRVPLYIACGVFGAPFGRFLLYIALSGALYVGLAFALLRSVDLMAGEQLRAIAPVVALTVAALFLAAGWLRRRWRSRSSAIAAEP